MHSVNSRLLEHITQKEAKIETRSILFYSCDFMFYVHYYAHYIMFIFVCFYSLKIPPEMTEIGELEKDGPCSRSAGMKGSLQPEATVQGKLDRELGQVDAKVSQNGSTQTGHSTKRKYSNYNYNS